MVVSGCPGLGHGFGSKMNGKVTFSFFVMLRNGASNEGGACVDKQRGPSSLCGETLGSGGDCGKLETHTPCTGELLFSSS